MSKDAISKFAFFSECCRFSQCCKALEHGSPWKPCARQNCTVHFKLTNLVYDAYECFCFHVCMFTPCMPGACGGWKRVSTGVTKNYELSCGFWELNLGPLLEVLLAAELSLLPLYYILFFLCLFSCPLTWNRKKLKKNGIITNGP